MQKSLVLTATLGAVLLFSSGASRASDVVLAQASGTNLGTPQSQPQPGGGVDRGVGAPTSASPALPGRDNSPVERRGPPAPGSGSASPGGDGSSSGTLTPGGAIRPGAAGTGSGTGGGGGTNSN